MPIERGTNTRDFGLAITPATALATSSGSAFLKPLCVSETGDHFGIGQGWHDHREADAASPVFQAQGVGEPEDGMLCGAIGCEARGGQHATHRSDVDDVTVTARQHPLRGQFGAQHHAEDVDVEHPCGDGVGLVDRATHRGDAGVVHQHVEGSSSTYCVWVGPGLETTSACRDGVFSDEPHDQLGVAESPGLRGSSPEAKNALAQRNAALAGSTSVSICSPLREPAKASTDMSVGTSVPRGSAAAAARR
jgi:hypothetical protein